MKTGETDQRKKGDLYYDYETFIRECSIRRGSSEDVSSRANDAKKESS